MKIRKLTALLATFVLLTAASAKELSNTRIASCLVKVTCDPAAVPLSLETIEQLLNSSGVGGKAAREILQIPIIDNASIQNVGVTVRPLSEEPQKESDETVYPLEQTAPILRKDLTAAATRTFAAEQTLFFELEVGLTKEVKPAAEEFMNALLDNLRKTLDAACDDYRTKIDQRFRLARGEAERAENELSNLQHELRALSDSLNLVPQVILADISRLTAELREIKMKQETNRALIEAISKRIKETEAKMYDKINTDPVLSELQKIIAMHEERVKKRMRKGTTEELSQARENLARARIELAERREQIRNSAGGELINSLNNQLAELSIEMPQADVRLKRLHTELITARHYLSAADDCERVSVKIKVAKQILEEAILLHSRMKRKSFLSLLIQPSVFVFGAE